MRPTSLTLSLSAPPSCPLSNDCSPFKPLPPPRAHCNVSDTPHAFSKKKTQQVFGCGPWLFVHVTPQSLEFPIAFGTWSRLGCAASWCPNLWQLLFFFHLSGESQLVKASYNKARLYLILRFHVCACITYSTGGPASPLLSGFPVKDFRVF